jgi:hypothetical protein
VATYRVHRIDTGMSVDQSALEVALNRLEGDVVSIVPNIMQFPFARVNYLLVVERVRGGDPDQA